ncbi:hypothetical protein GCM10010387_50060 [Streptomyces inusitatus]|uniref:Uncharacterized protein n=1 Tax=Streptomyces inusitatus TaxID=68221 RepID=A0A918UZL4_9ACTN|nr:hypothetical protein GCM10010387_50060 [Streptomyces inusitatus]
MRGLAAPPDDQRPPDGTPRLTGRLWGTLPCPNRKMARIPACQTACMGCLPEWVPDLRVWGVWDQAGPGVAPWGNPYTDSTSNTPDTVLPARAPLAARPQPPRRP